jgi:hypothetical protein
MTPETQVPTPLLVAILVYPTVVFGGLGGWFLFGHVLRIGRTR